MKYNVIKQNNKNNRKYSRFARLNNHFRQNTKLGIAKYNELKYKPILFVDNLYKKYSHKKAPAINRISFNVYPGQFHAFIGANGAGKTTSIKSIIAAYAKWSGTVLIKGKKNTSVDAKKTLGYIPENARFPTRMSCYSYLTWMARLSGFTKKDSKEFAVKRLHELNMWNLRTKSPNSFSSGQKKKILLAQALINNPEILVMDEPAANLDPKARLELYDTLERLSKEGRAILISSHVLAELDRYVNAATILDGGKIVFSGTTKELYERYADKKFSIDTDNKEKTKKYFYDQGIVFKKDEVTNRLLVKFRSSVEQNDFFNYCSKKKIKILYFNEIGNKLDDIYKKLIKFGSVDTMAK